MVQKLKISQLVNNTGQIEGVPANPRTIDKLDYQKLLKSLQDDPEYLEHEMPHVIAHGDKYVVLNGNQRLRALRELKFIETPVTIYKPDTPPEVIRARIIKSNHGYGKDDFDMLANDVWSDDPLCEWGMDLPDDWLQDEQEVVEDEAPEVDESEPPKSKLGEIYQLGRHRVMCGDSTDLDAVSNLADGRQVDLILTDPPYNMAYTGSATARRKPIENDKMDNFGEFVNDFMASMVSVAKSSAPYYVFTSEPEVPTIKTGFESNGLKPSQTIIWKKHRIGFGGADYQHQYEPLVYGWKSHKERYMVDKRNLSDVWEFSRPHRSDEHPTMKPIELLAYALQNSSKQDDIVLDLFLGSGSTLIACEQTDRTCYGMELDPKYVDVIRKRYWKFVNGGNEEGWENGTPAI